MFTKKVLKRKELKQLTGYYNALNYLSVGQLYLLDNPLLKRPLTKNDLKPNVVGHFGTAPGLNFIYMHLNRVIKKYGVNMIYITGPGHGGQALTSNVYLEGIYSKFYPNITMDETGLKKLFKEFSFPRGTSSHVSPMVPGSIHEGGELGYSLSHAYGAILDNPSLIACCVIGDGEAETGPLASAWHLNKIINPKEDGVVLPILHLNGYKISNPTILSRISKEELAELFYGYGYEPYYIEGDNPEKMHEEMAKLLDIVIEEIKRKKEEVNTGITDIKWPMIIFKTPKGWTGPKIIENKPIENSFRSHQIPIVANKENDKNIELLEKWLKSYHPEKLFDETGKIKDEYTSWLPDKNKMMSNQDMVNHTKEIVPLKLPNLSDYEFKIDKKGVTKAQDMIELGKYLEAVIKENPNNFMLFGPDEALSNRLNSVFNSTNRRWNLNVLKHDEYLKNNGRIIDSVLSEHACEGMLEGYILTGRHGIFHSYEAFVRIIDSMMGQHAKWLKQAKEVSWRKEIPSLNYILTSHVWQQDHNGYTHQEPGFLNQLILKKHEMIEIYLPPDANTLLVATEKMLKTSNKINAIVASKHPKIQWLTLEEAKKHLEKGISKWNFASNDKDKVDLIIASCGDTPTLEALAAVKILRENIKTIKIRFINVLDLMKLERLKTEEYNELFTKDTPIIFAFHGYPSLIRELTYDRENKNMNIHGYHEEGCITTAFDMRVQNKIDRFNLVLSALEKLPKTKKTIELSTWCNEMLDKHVRYIKRYGKDLDEIKNWTWQ